MPARTDSFDLGRLRLTSGVGRRVVLEVALDRVGGGRALMIGDATWDFRAAKQLDLPTVGLLTGQDVLTYNAVISLLLKVVAGTATLQDVSDIHANWPVFLSMAVRGVTVP